jgi:hypothetical protein
MANRAANVALLNQAFGNAAQSALQIQQLQRQKEQDAFRKQMLDLQAQEQKLRLDALKHEQNKAKTQEQMRDVFLQRLQNPTAPLEPSEPTGSAQGSPRQSSVSANASRVAEGQQPVDDQARALQLLGLASQAGMEPAFNAAAQQGLIQTPASQESQQRAALAAQLQQQQLEAGERNASEAAALDRTRQTLSAELKEHAKGRSALDKRRFELAATAMQSATAGQIPGILSELYPQVDEPTNAFQALMRQTGNVQKTLKILGDIEVDNKKRIASAKPVTPRSFGNDREAEAAARFNGRAFADLAPGEQKTINDVVFNSRIRLEQERMTGGRLPPDARREIGIIRALSGAVRELQSAFRPEFVGKFSFVANKIRIATGQATPELVAFASLHENLVDQLARERTGAVVGQHEASQFLRIIGSRFDEPSVFLSRLERFGRTLDIQEGNILDLSLKTGEELQNERNARRLRELSKKGVGAMSDEELLEFQRLSGR